MPTLTTAVLLRQDTGAKPNTSLLLSGHTPINPKIGSLTDCTGNAQVSGFKAYGFQPLTASHQDSKVCFHVGWLVEILNKYVRPLLEERAE